MAKPRFIKKRKKEILIILAVIITVGVVYFISKQQTQILHKELYIAKVKSESYIFKEEEYVNLDGEKINFSVKEGTKVGANTLLSKTYKLKTNKYIKEAIEVINWKLKNKAYNNRNKFITDLKKLDGKVVELEKKLELAEINEDENEIKTTKQELEKTKKKRNIMQKSLKYIFADGTTLKKIKGELKTKLNNFDNKLTISNINFSFTGYIYFSTDGYENVLDTGVLPALNNEYLDYIRNFRPEKQDAQGSTIKIVNNDAAYVCSFVDTKQYVAAEKTTLAMKKNLQKEVNFDKVGGYYEYLERRVDIMKSFPSISFEDEKGNVINGYLIDVYKKDHDKALIICVKDGINNIITETKTKYKLYTEQISAYVLPKRAIVEIDDKTYISILTTGKFKELVPVKVFKYENGKAFLKPDENSKVSENMEVILNPK